MKNPAEILAYKLRDRIITLSQQPPPRRRYTDEPQPYMMPAVHWPVEWLIETIQEAIAEAKAETECELTTRTSP